MRFKDVFSIIGPSMIGPSSSHTAGAIRLGRVARQLFGEMPARAVIDLYGSFAETYQGHGTDLALVGGLLDYDTDDARIPDSLDHSEDLGMEVQFIERKTPAAHPNTAEMTLTKGDSQLTVRGASIGGGNVVVDRVDGFDVKFTAIYPTIIISHQDRTGIIADITSALRMLNINIGYMDLDRKRRSGEAMTVIEVDSTIPVELIRELCNINSVTQVRKVDLSERGNQHEI